MGVIKRIMNRVLFFELCVNDSAKDLKVWSVCCKGNEILFAEQLLNVEEEIKKWKYTPAFLLITGDLIVCKCFQIDDPFSQRITDNPELLWDIYGEPDLERQMISFVRKEQTEDLTDLLNQNRIILLKKWVRAHGEGNEKKLIRDFYKEHFEFSSLFRNIPFANTLSLIVYHKIRLPVLLCFFVILLGNFGLNTYVYKEYEMVQGELHMNKRYSKERQVQSQKEGSILSQYKSVPVFPAALIADRIASYVPPRLMLSSLRLFPLEHAGSAFNQNKGLGRVDKKIRIKGETSIPGCVSLFSQYLEDDELFSGVKINSLVKKGDSSDFVFELEVEPEY